MSIIDKKCLVTLLSIIDKSDETSLVIGVKGQRCPFTSEGLSIIDKPSKPSLVSGGKILLSKCSKKYTGSLVSVNFFLSACFFIQTRSKPLFVRVLA